MGIGGNAVIVNVLVIGHIGDLGVVADAECACGALLDKGDIDFLPGKLRLAEPIVKQLGRNVAVFLADFDIKPFSPGMYHASFCPGAA